MIIKAPLKIFTLLQKGLACFFFTLYLVMHALAIAQPSEPRGDVDVDATMLPFEHRPIALTEQQTKWVKQHKKIRVAVDRAGWPPFDLITTNGLYRGYSGDLLMVVCRRLTIECEPIIYDTFDQAKRAVEAKQADILPSASEKTSIHHPLFLCPELGCDTVRESVR
jgi:ABC-type amino acid transport substrate-binding protein